MTSLRLFESSERWLYCLLFSAGTVLRPLHQAQRCQVPSAVRAGALPPSGGVPRAAGERQSATRRLRLQTDVPSLPAEVNITISTSIKPVAVSSVSLPWDVFTQYKSSCNLSIVFLNNQWVVWSMKCQKMGGNLYWWCPQMFISSCHREGKTPEAGSSKLFVLYFLFNNQNSI